MVNLVGDWKVNVQVLFSFSQYNGNDLLRNHQIIREWRVRVLFRNAGEERSPSKDLYAKPVG